MITDRYINSEKRFEPVVVDIPNWQIELLPQQGYEVAFKTNAPSIGFAFECQIGTHALSSDRKMPFHTKPNELAYVPAGCTVYSQSSHGGEYLKLTCQNPEFETIYPEYCLNEIIDPVVISAARELRRLLLSDERGIFFHYKNPVLCIEARFRIHSRSGQNDIRAGSWLTPHRFRRINDLIEANIHQDISVRQLSSSLGLSAGFFSRAFRMGIGSSPYDYVIECRIARARSLILTENWSLAEIALACGFSSHSHMTDTFRDRLGLTPSNLKKSIM